MGPRVDGRALHVGRDRLRGRRRAHPRAGPPPPPPSLPYKVDTSRSSLRTNWTRRILEQARDGWKLSHVFKPHTTAVRAVAFAPGRARLASCSEDGTVFFQRLVLAPGEGDEGGDVLKAVEPIGFVQCPGPVVSISWSPDGARLLACVAGQGARAGEVVEFTAPAAEEVDTSTTFDISEAVASRVYPFEMKVPVVEKPPKPEKKEGEDEDEDEEPEPEPEPPKIGSPVSCLFVTPSTFLLCMDGEDATGVVYECTFDFKHPIKELPTHDAPVTLLRVSHSGQFLISGTANGQVALRGIAEPQPDAARLLSRCWLANLHGAGTPVGGAALAWDDGALVSAGHDGNPPPPPSLPY